MKTSTTFFEQVPIAGVEAIVREIREKTSQANNTQPRHLATRCRNYVWKGTKYERRCITPR